jgi:histidinol dehydrogenase
MRILEGRAADNYVRKVERRGQRLDALEPRVRRIVQRVRRYGDKALRGYAEQWDGLSAGEALRVPEDDMQAALQGSSLELRSALETAAGNIRNFANGRSLWSGSGKAGPQAEPLVRVRLVPWDVMCLADAIPFPQLC